MVVFCAFEQIQSVIDEGKKHGLLKSYPLVFIKNLSLIHIFHKELFELPH